MACIKRHSTRTAQRKSIVELVTLILTGQPATTIYNGISHDMCVGLSYTCMRNDPANWSLVPPLSIRLIWRRLPSFDLKILTQHANFSRLRVQNDLMWCR